MVHGVSFECRESFHGFCFICIKNTVIAQNIRKESFHDSLMICENHKTYLSLSFVVYGTYIAAEENKILINSILSNLSPSKPCNTYSNMVNSRDGS